MNKSDSIVIIPTYNEKENIEKIIRAVFGLEKYFHILIIDDGSPDGTADIVKRLMSTEFADRLFIVERSGKQGLGTAYIAGFKWALDRDYEYVFEMDADFSHDPNDLPRLYAACHDEGNDVAVGSRYVSGVNVVNWPMGRVLMSYYASKYVRIVTGIKVRDTTAGFVCYRRRVLQTIELDKIRFKGYAFQIEMKYTAHKIGFKIKEVPVIFVNRREGTSKMSGGIFSEAFFGVMRLRWDGWTRKYPPLPAALLTLLLTLATPALAQPKVTTDQRFARGATMAFGRMTATPGSAAISERGFCWASHRLPTVDDSKTTTTLQNNGAIYWLKDLQPATLYYMRAYAVDRDGKVGYGDDIKFYTLPKGEVTFTMRTSGDANSERIKAAAQTAIDWWNALTEMKDYAPSIGYASGTPTADCSYGGWMRVGPNQGNQKPGTIMHEMLHGCGVIPGYGTAWSGTDLRSGNGTGLWLGDRVTEVLRFWDNSTTAQLNGDNQHMWPYGVNGAHEDNGSDVLYIGNSLICQALGEDGLQHTYTHFAEPYYALQQEDTIKYYLKSEDAACGLYTSYVVPNASGNLRLREMTAAEAQQNDSAAWYITFTPHNQYYQLCNAATGQYMTYQGGFKTMKRTTLSDADDFHLMRGRVDVAGTEGLRGYWLVHPSDNWTPNCLKANASGSVASQQLSLANAATEQRWLILSAAEMNAFDQAAVQQIKTQVNDMLRVVRALADVPHTTSTADADQQFASALGSIEQQLQATASPSQLSSLADAVRQAAVDFLNLVTPAHSSQPFDITFLMQNPGMDATDGWSTAATLNCSCAEFYEKSFNFYQILQDLPRGTFGFMAQGFQRPGASADAYDDYAAGTNRVNAYIYAGTKNAKLCHIASWAQASKLGGSESTVGSGLYMPNDMQAASIYFARGLYENCVYIDNSAATTLRVGLSCSSMQSKYWCIFDNFRLYFYGSLSPQTITGIEQATTLPATDGKAYTLDGRRVGDRAHKGIYIRDGRKHLQH